MSFRFLSIDFRLPIVFLALAEGLLLALSPKFATVLRDATVLDPGHVAAVQLFPSALLFALFGVVSYVAFGLYSTRNRIGFRGIVLRQAAGVLTAAALSIFLYHMLPQLNIGPDVLVMASVLAVSASIAARWLFEQVVDQQVLKRRLLVYGASRRATTLLGLRRRVDTRGFLIVGFVPADGDAIAVPTDRLVPRPDNLRAWCREHSIDEIVVAMEDRRLAFPAEELLSCRLAGIKVLDLLCFLERETGKVRPDMLHPGWLIFGDGFRASTVQRALQRAFDIVTSLGLLLYALPLMIVTACVIRVEDGWKSPVIYRQRRVGQHGNLFDVLKFRSMIVDAEPDGVVWSTVNDARITRVGKVIRKMRIDELPQLLNILRGDMSFVGPRPERPEFVEQLARKIPYYSQRHIVKPGLTGWAQLCFRYGSSDDDAAEKLQYDLYYVKNRSLLLDFAIVLQTVEVVLWGKGGR